MVTSQPASWNWPANKPSDKMSTWLYIRSVGKHLPKCRKVIWFLSTLWGFALASHRPFIEKMFDNSLDNQSASQLQLASQPAIWQNAKLILILILRGYLSFTSLHKWHLPDGKMANQILLPSQPAIWQNVNLALSQILGVQLTKSQPDPKSDLGSLHLPCHVTSFTIYFFHAMSLHSLSISSIPRQKYVKISILKEI